MKPTILAISGSTRKESSNLKLIHFIQSHYADIIKLELYQSIDQLPHFNPDLDNENPPKKVVEFRKLIESADGVIICSPEYVFSLPGSLKNAIEWTVSTTVFSDKPIGLIVASGLGEKAFESLHLIMTTVEAKIPKQAQLLIQGARGKMDDHGQIEDLDLLKKLDTFTQALMESIESNL